MKLAVIKPDHLGDLVLSSPAIRALSASYPDLTLFVGTPTTTLATFLFPTLNINRFDLAHLTKGAVAEGPKPDFGAFDAVAILRKDGVITPSWASLHMPRFVMPHDNNADHQTVLDYGVAREFVQPYDIDALFFGDRLAAIQRKAASEPVKIGLSIGSGFYANIWPLVHWVELGRRLKAQGRIVKLVFGAAERSVAKVLSEEVGLSPFDSIEGGSDFADFFEKTADLDVVIASDGGTAHLCSLVAPILSIFGPSPLQRYTPFGAWNKTLSQMLNCSPCCQYSQTLINGCLSVECMGGISPDDVIVALERPIRHEEVGTMKRLRPGLTLFNGLSHSDRSHKLAAYEREHQIWSAGAHV